MAKRNSANQDYTNNADGWDLSGGTTPRKLTLSGADVAIVGTGTAVMTFPSTSQTLVGRTTTDTLTNKTLTSPVINTGTIGTSLLPTSNDGAALGASGTAFADLFLASGAVVNWNAGNMTLTHAAGTLSVAGGALGVGTSTPAGALQLSGAGTDTALLGATAGSTSNALLNFSPSSDGIVRWGFRIGATANFPLNIDYRDSASGNPTNLVQMTRTGFFGINGTPTAKLHVRESSDSSSVQVAIFEGDRATMATNDEAYMTLRLSDTAGNQDEFARIGWRASDVTSTSEDGVLEFYTVVAGSLTKQVKIIGNNSLGPNANDQMSLGVSGTAFSDLFLASGGVINWAASDFTLTHSTGVLTASGSLTAATFRSTSGGLVNNSSSNNARYQPASTGSTIDRNIADSSPCLIVQQVHASSTGDILQVKNNAATVLTIAQTGAATFSSTLSIGTSNALTAGTIELGAASDTTLSRSAAGVLAVEGVVIPSISSTNTLTNKRITARTGTTTSSATPTINTDNVDMYLITAQTVDITSFTTNLSGTPTEGQKLWIAITGTAARAITWGASFEASTVALPTTTVSTNRLDVGFVWNTVSSKWRCVATC